MGNLTLKNKNVRKSDEKDETAERIRLYHERTQKMMTDRYILVLKYKADYYKNRYDTILTMYEELQAKLEKYKILLEQYFKHKF